MATQTYQAWDEPRLWNWSFQVTRLLGIIDFGGADFTEIHEVVQRIKSGDDESWYREWSRMGRLCEEQAAEAERFGNRLSARFASQRASNYHRASQFYVTGEDTRKVPALRKTQETFRAAIPHFDHRCETVEIPYEGVTLAGYFVPSRVGKGRLPTILYLNGADSLSEEAYFTVALPASMAGYHCLVFNAPGVGLTLYEKGLPTRPDCEHFVTPVVDLLSKRPDVDPKRICLVGESFAAYLIPRAAAFEPRVAAAVSWGALYSWGDDYRPRDWYATPPHANLRSLIGAKTVEQFWEMRDKYNLKGVLERIACPMFYLVGGEDWAPLAVSQGVRCLEETGSKIKRLRVVERAHGMGGVTHCQKDNLHVMHAYTFSFLNEVLAYRP
ncbi:MAG: alpha/beta hydrolase family protein [Gemmatimonadales bacterium]